MRSASPAEAERPARCREITAFCLSDRTAFGNTHVSINREDRIMKRSRRVVLTLMGSAAVSAVSQAVEARPFDCGPGMTAIPGPNGQPYCRPVAGGFGGSFHHFHGHGGHGHGGHGHAGG
jgi:hypothetical protein